jgi:feruloyl-CoA synthase
LQVRHRIAVLLSSPPSFEAGEITDKAYVNQRVVIAKRAGDVARLFFRLTQLRKTF